MKLDFLNLWKRSDPHSLLYKIGPKKANYPQPFLQHRPFFRYVWWHTYLKEINNFEWGKEKKKKKKPHKTNFAFSSMNVCGVCGYVFFKLMLKFTSDKNQTKLSNISIL